jgi:hypothetical protein
MDAINTVALEDSTTKEINVTNDAEVIPHSFEISRGSINLYCTPSFPTYTFLPTSSSVVASKKIPSNRENLSFVDLMCQTRKVTKRLSALRDNHYRILSEIGDQYENQRNDNKNSVSSDQNTTSSDMNSTTDSSDSSLAACKSQNDRNKWLHSLNHWKATLQNVNASLEKVENGIDESCVLLALAEVGLGFTRLETDHEMLRLEMKSVVEENERMHEELSDTQKRLIESECELGIIQ